MKKIYFNNDGWVCERYPYNLIKGENFLEVDDITFEKTLSAPKYFAWKVVNGVVVLERYENELTSDILNKELQELLEWFEWYDIQICQFNRSVRQNIPFDKNIQELDMQAISKANRINEIKQIVNN